MDIVVFVIIFIFIILIVFGILVIDVYNKLVFYRDRLFKKFDSVDGLIGERVVIMNNIISVILDNNLHEDDIIRDINKVIDDINNYEDINDRLLLVKSSADIINRAFSLSKVYDKLKRVDRFNLDKNEFFSNTNEINYAGAIYNEEVLKYNNCKNALFGNFVFKLFRFREYDYYDEKI